MYQSCVNECSWKLIKEVGEDGCQGLKNAAMEKYNKKEIIILGVTKNNIRFFKYIKGKR